MKSTTKIQFAPQYCLTTNDIQNLTTTFQMSQTASIFFVYVKLRISKSKEIIDISTVNSFKAKLKKNGSVASRLNKNKRQQSQYFHKQDFCSQKVLLHHGREMQSYCELVSS